MWIITLKIQNDLFFLSQKKNVPENRHEKWRELPNYYLKMFLTNAWRFTDLQVENHNFLRRVVVLIFGNHTGFSVFIHSESDTLTERFYFRGLSNKFGNI